MNSKKRLTNSSVSNALDIMDYTTKKQDSFNSLTNKSEENRYKTIKENK